jgi:hypothetical protein
MSIWKEKNKEKSECIISAKSYCSFVPFFNPHVLVLFNCSLILYGCTYVVCQVTVR